MSAYRGKVITLLSGTQATHYSSYLEKAELPYVAACLNSMCQGINQLLNISKSQIDPLPCQRVNHMRGISNKRQPGPHIPARIGS